MKKRPPTKGKKTSSNKVKSLVTGFALGAAALVGIAKNQRSPGMEKNSPLEISDGPGCKEAFSKAITPDPLITLMLEALDAPGSNNMSTIRTIAQRSYASKDQPLSELLIARISRDLRLLLHYNGPTKKTFTSELETAIRQFQSYSSLEETGRPNPQTLARMAEEASLQRMRMVLTVKQVARAHKLPARDLLVLIDAESSGDPTAASDSSTALGLGQFTEETWLHLVAEHGKDVLGDTRYAKEAQGILAARNKGEKLSMQQIIDQAQILGRRTEIDTSIEMIARYAKQISDGGFSASKAYIAYFLGPNGYKTLMKNLDKDVSKIMKMAARANSETFYKTLETTDKKGRRIKTKVGRTGQEILDLVTSRVEVESRIKQANRDLADADQLLSIDGRKLQYAALPVVCAPSIATTQAGLQVSFKVK